MAKTKRGSCWDGYHRVPGTKQGTPGSCAKNKFNMKTKKRTRKRKSRKNRKTPNRRTNRRTNRSSCKPRGNQRSAKIVNGKCVRFGYKPMPIKASNPARRRSFCARHRCSQKRDKATAGYQSCKAWKCKTG
tara:strand:- start:78 stop:470 length:393 start_codon:yes stop_codon:yes gene_type:complete